MDAYLQNLKCLRSQMNDIEEESERRSVEEQKQKTVIDSLQKDLVQVRSQSKRVNEEAMEMAKARAEVCVQILEKQHKISALESESLTLSQTMELLQQELVSVSLRLKEKRLYYAKIADESTVKLHDQHDWLMSRKRKLVADNPSTEEEANGKYNDLVTQLESAKLKLDDLHAKKSEIALERSKEEERMEQLKQRIDGIPPEVKAMDLNALEEERKALLADKAGETEYLQSLRDQTEQVKGISDVIKCQCGEEYQVGLMV